MKKILVLLLALLMVSGVLFAEDPVLTVYGFVTAEDPETIFTSTQTLTAPGIDLKTNTDIHGGVAGGNGVKIGTWKIATFNHLGTESYKVKYTFSPLVNATESLSLGYNVIEADGGTLSAAIASGGFGDNYGPVPSGNNEKSRDVRVRLTAAATSTVLGLTVTAIENLQSTITLALVIN
ncbi:MAG: hypothetical protein WC182_05760 [Bacilli bacterium]|jgi:hypothetical protein